MSGGVGGGGANRPLSPIHRGRRGRAFQHLVDGIAYGMLLMYIGQRAPVELLTNLTPTKHQRNEDIRARYVAGEAVVDLARLFGISEQRVSQIVHR